MFAMTMEDFNNHSTSFDVRSQFDYAGTLLSKIQKDLAQHVEISKISKNLKLLNLVVDTLIQSLEEVVDAGQAINLPFELDLFIYKTAPNLEIELDKILTDLEKHQISFFSYFQFKRLLKNLRVTHKNLLKLFNILKKFSKLSEWDIKLIESSGNSLSTLEFFPESEIHLTEKGCKLFYEDLKDDSEEPNQALLDAVKNYKSFLAAQ